MELRWVLVYQVLHKLLSAIGYGNEIILEPAPAQRSDGEPRIFCLDDIFMKEVISGRDPQVIRHLLQHAAEEPTTPHISLEHLFSSLIGSIKTFYLEDGDKTSLEKNFFVFHCYAKGVLDLLAEHTDIDPVMVSNEQKLLEAAHYLAYHQLLEELSVR